MKKICLLLCIFTFLLSGRHILAQQDNSDGAIATQYYIQVSNEYREKERVYRIAKTQHQQLDTLATQEALIKDTAAAMRWRAKVLEAHWQILQLQLTAATGVPLETKNNLLASLISEREWLRSQDEILDAVVDATIVEAHAAEFAERTEAQANLHSSIEAALTFGGMQAAFDKQRSLLTSIQQWVTENYEGDELNRHQRGFAQVEVDINTVATELQTVQIALFSSERRQYRQALEAIDDIYQMQLGITADFREILGIVGK